MKKTENDFRTTYFINLAKTLQKSGFIKFFLVGITGVIINLTITFILAEFVFGRILYFYAYIIGLFANLAYNFILHTFVTFSVNKNHLARFVIFITYNITMSIFQALIVKTTVDYIGIDYYLIVIASTIGLFFLINFFVSKFWIFKKKIRG